MKDAVIYTQYFDGATIAILWGGLQTANPSSWMDRIGHVYCGCNQYHKYIELIPLPKHCPLSKADYESLFTKPLIITTDLSNLPFVHFSNKVSSKIKIYRHALIADGTKGKETGEVVVLFHQDFSAQCDQITHDLDRVQKLVIKNRKCNVFVNEHRDNPFLRIIIFKIDELQFEPFSKQRIPTLCDLGQFSHAINDEEITSMAYITRDWLSFMTSITKAKKQVIEDTIRYLLCEYWERRIDGKFETEENYKCFPSREMDMCWTNNGIKFLVEVKYVSENTDKTQELRRFFNDLYRLSLEKVFLNKDESNTQSIRCLFVVFGPSSLFERHLRIYGTDYTGLHPNCTFNKGKRKLHILRRCLSFDREDPNRVIKQDEVTKDYYTRFKTDYGEQLEKESFTTDLLELAVAENALDTKQQCVAIWEVDRDNLETENNA